MSVGNSSADIRGGLFDKGFDKINSRASDIATELEAIKDGDELSETNLLLLQQKISSQANVISLMSTIMKTMSDTDKEVGRNC